MRQVYIIKDKMYLLFKQVHNFQCLHNLKFEIIQTFHTLLLSATELPYIDCILCRNKNAYYFSFKISSLY